MSVLREAVCLQMRLRGFSPRTHESYLHALEQLWAFYERPLERLSCQEVQRFLDEVITVRKLAWATVNVYFSACRFLYEQVLKRPAREFSIPRRGRSGKRPGVLSRQEVERLIAAPRNVKHRALLAMTYGSGLRVSEAVQVAPRHIDRGRLMLFVTGKGHKDRYTVLTPARPDIAPPVKLPRRNSGSTRAWPRCCPCSTSMSCSPCRTASTR
jgi:integrase/recombinase XerD